MMNNDKPLTQSKKKKAGRPPAENPKIKRVGLRLDNTSLKILDDYCKLTNVDRSEAIRIAIKSLAAEVNFYGSPEWQSKVQQSQQLFNEATVSINKLLKDLCELKYINKEKGDNNENQ
ncbi:ribbon-helix-helix protein, CopG family [Paenibacillus phytohabitans]|uniref:ribbon-helix-helix protein, CopG family n=1 Tax=Paenibacillus phytohabitans TaxID=2654978 RepID=UPI001C11FF9D|nr:ribbon-helix-helix protein, CopG family [Paenibacillus phytohabitans]